MRQMRTSQTSWTFRMTVKCTRPAIDSRKTTASPRVRRGNEMPDDVQIRCLQTIGDREIQGLSDVLIDCVEGGASVSFMLPMSHAKAEAYWRSTAASLASGERVVLAAEDGAGAIVGTVQVLLDQPENQPHRGDLAKMLVHRCA